MYHAVFLHTYTHTLPGEERLHNKTIPVFGFKKDSIQYQ
jgi:hypothetical protein